MLARARPARPRRRDGRAPRRHPRRRRPPGRCARRSRTRPAGPRRARCPRPRSPAVRPASVSVATSPAGLGPKRKFAPTTTAAACSPSTSTRSMNSCGVQAAISRENGITKTSSTPASASSAHRRSMSVSVSGACSGRSTAIGCGSKVTATTLSPSRVGELAGAADDVAVAEVDPVEVADDHDRATEVGRARRQGNARFARREHLLAGSAVRRRRPSSAGQTKTATARASARPARRAPGTRRPGRTAPPVPACPRSSGELAAEAARRRPARSSSSTTGKLRRAASLDRAAAANSRSSWSSVRARSSVVGPDGRTPQRGQVPPVPSRAPRSRAMGADVGAAGAPHRTSTSTPSSPAERVHLDRVDAHRSRLQLDLLAGARPGRRPAGRRP